MLNNIIEAELGITTLLNVDNLEQYGQHNIACSILV